MRALILAFCMAAPAACGQSAPAPAPKAEAAPRPAPAAAAEAIAGEGVITRIDVNAGAVALNHEPLPAINWPAMTMGFIVDDPALLQGLQVGDRVAFTIKSAHEATTITALRKL